MVRPHLPDPLSLRSLPREGGAALAGPAANLHGTNSRIIKAVLTASLYPNVVKIVFPETQYKQLLAGSIPVDVQPRELQFLLKSGGSLALLAFRREILTRLGSLREVFHPPQERQ